MLIRSQYLDLIIARKNIHKLKDDTSSIIVDDLIDIWSWIVVFWTRSIEILKIDTNPNFCFLVIETIYKPILSKVWVK